MTDEKNVVPSAPTIRTLNRWYARYKTLRRGVKCPKSIATIFLGKSCTRKGRVPAGEDDPVPGSTSHPSRRQQHHDPSASSTKAQLRKGLERAFVSIMYTIQPNPPGAHLEAIRLNQVARAQDTVEPGQEPHRPRAEGPVLLRKRRGVQASVCRAIVGQRLQGGRDKTAKREKLAKLSAV